MMPRLWTPLVLFGLSAAVACSDTPTPPEAAVLTILAHHQLTGENLLISANGSDVGSLGPTTVNMVPIGAYTTDGTIALLAGNAIVLTTLAHPEVIDTLIQPAPTSQSLLSFSPTGVLFALVSYSPTRAVLVYDRANKTIDTLAIGNLEPALPPVFSPQGDRIALLTVTPLSVMVTILDLNAPSQFYSEPLQVSRLLNQPLFGWPRWIGDGIHMAFRRVAEAGPDTLVVGVVRPDNADASLEEQYRAVMSPSDQRPEIEFGPSSTYSLSADGRAVVIAALPSVGASAHSLYVVTPSLPRIRIVHDDPGVRLYFPQFINQ
jgi:hypothetical protein